MNSTPQDIYVYKMTVDSGAAPCVYAGVLSLAICKPIIWHAAKEGSLIFGFGGQGLGGRLIYAAYITEKLAPGEYYRQRRFRDRPDRIYRDVGGSAVRIAGALFHENPKDLFKDVGANFEKAHVLLSTAWRSVRILSAREAPVKPTSIIVGEFQSSPLAVDRPSCPVPSSW